MNAFVSIGMLAARYGRTLLIAGLLVGIFVPRLALLMKDWLPELVAMLLFLGAFRIGPYNALAAFRNMTSALGIVLIFQLLLPVIFVSLLLMAGFKGSVLIASLALMLSAPSISGSPNLTIMTGHDPAPALQLLVVGTALMPLTFFPTFWLLPDLGSTELVIRAAFRLLLVIAAATGVAFFLRWMFLKHPDERAMKAIDGYSALALGIMVIGLMSSVGPTLFGDPAKFTLWLGIAFLANFGLQIVVWFGLRHKIQPSQQVPASIIAGNRNIALYLVGLPASVTDPLLLFIGCYQIPMFMTPLLLRRMYAKD